MATRVVFDHERLQVYQLGINLVEAVDGFAPNFTGVRRHLAWQLHRAAIRELLENLVPMLIALTRNVRNSGRA